MLMFTSFLTKSYNKSNLHEQIRSIRKWTNRIPKKIIFPEEEIETEKIHVENDQTEQIQNSKYPTTFSFQNKTKKLSEDLILTTRKVKKRKEMNISSFDMLETVIDSEGNFIYTKMKDNDARISKILSNLKSEKSRRKEDSIIIEGKRLINDALSAGCRLKYLLFSRKDDIEDIVKYLPKTGANLYKMPYREIQMWSDLTTSPGIMGIFKIPQIEENPFEIPVSVICDNVREPGNLGAILRTAVGVGCKRIILTKGCCDIWNSKVLRSAMGAHFRMKIDTLNWDDIKSISNTDWFIADNKILNTSTNSSPILELINKIPVVSYDSLKYSTSNEISLIIGGETEGVSEEAYTILKELGGLRLNIPLSNKIESLNSGTALGVLLYEIRRQIKLNSV